jgi:broad specificity phosphatase PhoE
MVILYALKGRINSAAIPVKVNNRHIMHIHRKVQHLEETDISLLAECDGLKKVKLVVRHAERPLFKTAKAPNNVSITTGGRDEAERLGGLLSRHGLTMNGCASSPVRRCIQTAEHIAHGNRFRGKVDASPRLGGSDLFNDDEEALNATFDAHTIEEIIAMQLEGEKVPGMKVMEEALRIFLGQVLSDQDRKFEVLVSHDLFVCQAVHYLTGTKFSPERCTGFLEGFFIAFRDDLAWVLWDGRWYDVTDRLSSLMS